MGLFEPDVDFDSSFWASLAANNNTVDLDGGLLRDEGQSDKAKVSESHKRLVADDVKLCPVLGKREGGDDLAGGSQKRKKSGRANVRRGEEFQRVLSLFLENEYEQRRQRGIQGALWTISREEPSFANWGSYQWKRLTYFIFQSSGQTRERSDRENGGVVFDGLRLLHYVRARTSRGDSES